MTAIGIDVIREPLIVEYPDSEVARLYRTKAERFNHHIDPSAFINVDETRDEPDGATSDE